MSKQANGHQGSKSPEPYFFNILDPSSKGLSKEELDHFLYDRFVFVDTKGKTWNKEQIIDHLLNGGPKIELFEQNNTEVVNWGQDKAYVQRSIIRAKGTYLGRELDGRFRCASMVLNDPAGWKLFNYQLTEIK